RVYPQEGLFGRVVDPVMDVEVDLGGLANPGAMHIRLVGQDHRGGNRADRLAPLLLVVPHGRHHQREITHRHTVLQDVVHQQRTGWPVVLASHHVPHVVQVRGDAGQIGDATFLSQTGQDVV